MTISALIDQFLRWCERHRSGATVRAYRGRLKSLAEKHGGQAIDELNPIAIDEWLWAASHRKDGTPYAADTQRLQIVVWQRFQVWLLEQKILASPITGKLEKPAGKMRERIPTRQETIQLLRHAPREFRRIYKALRQSGARPNELCRTTFAHIDKDLSAIVHKSHKTAKKTGKARVIVIGAKFSRMIQQAARGRTEGHIWLNSRGKPWTVQSLSRMYQRLREKAGLPDDLCLYLARHEHATKLCQQKGIHAAAQSLGHASIQTTQRYVKRDIESMRDNQDLV